jgi:polysaccharide biosynthesis protein VpsM
MRKHIIISILFLLLVSPAIGLAQDEEIEGSDLYGSGSDYFHPYLTVTGLYDDNVYRVEQGKISDYATIFSPGIWIAVPGTHENKLNLNTSSLTPGGLGIVEDRGEMFKRFQGFLNYGAKLARYNQEDDNNTNDQRLEGLFQFNLKSGLRLEMLDILNHDHDERDEGSLGQLTTYTSNLLRGRATYDFDTRFRIRGEYSHFNVDYDKDANKYANRVDDKYSSSLFYKLTGKSSIFIEYDLVNISYYNIDGYDSLENIAWGGYRWRLSEKTMGEIKTGYINKDYSQAGLGNTSDFVMQGWLDYEFTHKSRVKLTVARLIQEPDVWELMAKNQKSQTVSSNSSGAVDNQFKVDLFYDLSTKLHANVEGEYRKISFMGDYIYNGETGERTDDKYTGSLGLNYQIQDWIGTKVSYTYIDRESTLSGLSYTDNQVMINLSLSM